MRFGSSSVTQFQVYILLSNGAPLFPLQEEWEKVLFFNFQLFDRENATADKVKEAHRKVMVANHPDAGGSHYLASKINEAKDVMLGKKRDGGSPF